MHARPRRLAVAYSSRAAAIFASYRARGCAALHKSRERFMRRAFFMHVFTVTRGTKQRRFSARNRALIAANSRISHVSLARETPHHVLHTSTAALYIHSLVGNLPHDEAKHTCLFATRELIRDERRKKLTIAQRLRFSLLSVVASRTERRLRKSCDFRGCNAFHSSFFFVATVRERRRRATAKKQLRSSSRATTHTPVTREVTLSSSRSLARRSVTRARTVALAALVIAIIISSGALSSFRLSCARLSRWLFPAPCENKCGTRPDRARVRAQN